MNVIEMTEVIGGKRYSTATATLIASDAYWDGHNWERQGRNTFLFRTPNGRYFQQLRTRWEGENDGKLTPLELDEAVSLYETLREKRVRFEDAFPGVVITEA